MVRSKARPTRIFFAADIHGSQVDVPEVPRRPRGVLRGRRARVRRRPHGQGPRADRAVERRVPAPLPGARQEFERGRAGRVHASASSSPASTGRCSSRDEYEAVEADPLAKHGLFQRAGVGARLAEWIELAEDRLRGHRRSAVHDRRQRRRAGGARDAGTARRGPRRRVRGPAGRPGRRAHDDHGRPVDGHAVGHAARGERGGDRARRSTRRWRAVPDVGRCVFNLHCPPKDTPIDTCLKLEIAPRRAAAADPRGRPVPDDRRRERGGAGGDRAVPAARRASTATSTSRGAGSGSGRTQMLQPGERVRAGRAAGLDRGAQAAGSSRRYQHTRGELGVRSTVSFARDSHDARSGAAVVIGAGIVGASAAYHLAELGDHRRARARPGPVVRDRGVDARTRPGSCSRRTARGRCAGSPRTRSTLYATLDVDGEPAWYGVGGIEVATTPRRESRS